MPMLPAANRWIRRERRPFRVKVPALLRKFRAIIIRSWDCRYGGCTQSWKSGSRYWFKTLFFVWWMRCRRISITVIQALGKGQPAVQLCHPAPVYVKLHKHAVKGVNLLQNGLRFFWSVKSSWNFPEKYLKETRKRNSGHLFRRIEKCSNKYKLLAM